MTLHLKINWTLVSWNFLQRDNYIQHTYTIWMEAIELARGVSNALLGIDLNKPGEHSDLKPGTDSCTAAAARVLSLAINFYSKENTTVV